MNAPRTYAEFCEKYGLSPDRERPTKAAAEREAQERAAKKERDRRDVACRRQGLATDAERARSVLAFGPYWAELLFSRSPIPGPRSPTEAALDRSAAGKNQ